MVAFGEGRQSVACGRPNLANVAAAVMAQVAAEGIEKSNVVGIWV